MAHNPPNIGHEPQGYTRDAIHVAVIATIASEVLTPGQHVGVEKIEKEYYESVTDSHIGIVDPFRTKNVSPGELFWLMLYPNTVQSLRHHWVHPALGDVDVDDVKPLPFKEEKEEKQEDPRTKEATEYMEVIAKNYELTYSQVILMGHNYKNNGDYYTIYDPDAHAGDYPDYWDHWEVLTGMYRPDKDQYNYLPPIPVSCSC